MLESTRYGWNQNWEHKIQKNTSAAAKQRVGLQSNLKRSNCFGTFIKLRKCCVFTWRSFFFGIDSWSIWCHWMYQSWSSVRLPLQLLWLLLIRLPSCCFCCLFWYLCCHLLPWHQFLRHPIDRPSSVHQLPCCLFNPTKILSSWNPNILFP